jgi:F-type H+-transporting ATPase subunit epsilon
MEFMHITIAKVDETYFDGEAESLTVPGTGGELTIMGNHMPLITTLKEGSIVVRDKSLSAGRQEFPIQGGVLEVRAEGATVLL